MTPKIRVRLVSGKLYGYLDFRDSQTRRRHHCGLGPVSEEQASELRNVVPDAVAALPDGIKNKLDKLRVPDKKVEEQAEDDPQVIFGRFCATHTRLCYFLGVLRNLCQESMTGTNRTRALSEAERHIREAKRIVVDLQAAWQRATGEDEPEAPTEDDLPF
jgi:hypothetical protein